MAKSSIPDTTEKDDFIEVPLTEATHAQLMWFSKQQGYDVDEAETESQTFNRIKTAWEFPTIKVPGTMPKPIHKPVTVTLKEDTTTSDSERYGLPETVDVLVQGDGDDPEELVKLAHNGRTYLLKVGEVVTLPWYVFKGCIDDAKEIKYSTGKDSGLGPSRFVQSISFTRVR